jgi:hypothetical protein
MGAASLYYTGDIALETTDEGIHLTSQDADIGTTIGITAFDINADPVRPNNTQGLYVFDTRTPDMRYGIHIHPTTGDVNTRAFNPGSSMAFQSYPTATPTAHVNMILAYPDGGAILSYTGLKALETTVSGIDVFDTSVADIPTILFRENGSTALGNMVFTAAGTFQVYDNVNSSIHMVATGGAAVSLYYNGTAAFHTTALGIQVVNILGKHATLGFTDANDNIVLRNGINSGHIRLEGKDDGSALSTVFLGDPDDAAELYFDGTKMLSTSTTGAYGGIHLYSAAGVDSLWILGNGSADTIIRSQVEGAFLRLQGTETTSLDNNTMFQGDPDGGVELYWIGLPVLKTTAAGFDIWDSDGDDPTLRFVSSAGDNQGFIAFTNGGGFQVYDDVTNDYLITSLPAGAVELYYAGSKKFATVSGGVYITNDCSALTFTDRTPFYEGNAVEEIKKIKGNSGNIDHSTLPEFARRTHADGSDGRDLGAMISVLVKAVQELSAEVEALKQK